jgi:hypothetical protein
VKRFLPRMNADGRGSGDLVIGRFGENLNHKGHEGTQRFVFSWPSLSLGATLLAICIYLRASAANRYFNFPISRLLNYPICPVQAFALRSSSSSSVRGQSSRSKRLSDRSANSLPPVWHLAQ